MTMTSLPSATQNIKRSSGSRLAPKVSRRGRPRKERLAASPELLLRRRAFISQSGLSNTEPKGADEQFLKAEYETTGLHYLYHHGDIGEDELKVGVAYANETVKILCTLVPEMRMRLSSWNITGVRAGWSHSTNSKQPSIKTIKAIRRLQILTRALREVSPHLPDLIRDLALETFEPSNPMHIKTLCHHKPYVRNGLKILVLHDVVTRAQRMRRLGITEALKKNSQNF